MHFSCAGCLQRDALTATLTRIRKTVISAITSPERSAIKYACGFFCVTAGKLGTLLAKRAGKLPGCMMVQIVKNLLLDMLDCHAAQHERRGQIMLSPEIGGLFVAYCI